MLLIPASKGMIGYPSYALTGITVAALAGQLTPWLEHPADTG